MREKFSLPEDLKSKILNLTGDKTLASNIILTFEGFLLECREKKGLVHEKGLFFEFLNNLGYQGYQPTLKENAYDI